MRAICGSKGHGILRLCTVYLKTVDQHSGNTPCSFIDGYQFLDEPAAFIIRVPSEWRHQVTKLNGWTTRKTVAMTVTVLRTLSLML